ncbi:hypothetical protein [Telluribacter sp.]|jgi:hypothetical protein|uniref:hypothetical protein n=1 Tax=Telluribacter sp. TaxID=1978767 RepID=UPI002E11F57E|nr:hypothetical protein [Telluribacter sp.]
MKKVIYSALVIGFSFSMTSCATLFGGKVADCQRIKPKEGQPQRQVRVGALVADILLFAPAAIIDFATGAIYKPCATKTVTGDVNATTPSVATAKPATTSGN